MTAPTARGFEGLARARLWSLLGFVGPSLLLLVLACSKGPEMKEGGVAAGPAIVRTAESGPVKATVEVRPEKPKLGDRVGLVLTVEAKPGVRVEMPAFGEALGRFSVLSFVPRSETKPDGTTVSVQKYELEPPMSGRNRIPSLRIQYFEEKKATTGESGKELLTETVPMDVASVLPADAKLELKPLAEALPEDWARGRRWVWPLVVLLGLGLAALLIWYRLRRTTQQRTAASAFDVAMGRLAALEARGLPEGAEVDAFYVELSAIVRRYVEDRYGIRAPELTTEEFFREASRSSDLKEDHRRLLETFLVECDRVKFAAHRPGPEESKVSLTVARRFLEETRLSSEVLVESTISLPPAQRGAA